MAQQPAQDLTRQGPTHRVRLARRRISLATETGCGTGPSVLGRAIYQITSSWNCTSFAAVGEAM